jgi:hypothetical protein
VIPEIDIWRATNLMLKRYGEKALEESAARADELASHDDYNAAVIWRRITVAVEQLEHHAFRAGALIEWGSRWPHLPLRVLNRATKKGRLGGERLLRR